METQEASGKVPTTARSPLSSLIKKQICALDSSKSLERKLNTLNDPAFLTSIVMPPTIKLSEKPDLHRDDSLTSQLSAETLQFKPQLTSL